MRNTRAFMLLLFGLVACAEDTPAVAAHAHGPHDGMRAPFRGTAATGHLELKLHDDKGDLELWLGKDETLGEPFDLPVDATIEVEFLDIDDRKITLRPRDTAENEDEDGKPNIRDGKTNYFIFPSKAGEDASWLKGKNFKSRVVVRFARDTTKFESSQLLLQPHSH